MSFKTVICATPVIRQVELIELPSTSDRMTCPRVSGLSLFMHKNICLRPQEVKLIVTCQTPQTELNCSSATFGSASSLSKVVAPVGNDPTTSWLATKRSN